MLKHTKSYYHWKGLVEFDTYFDKSEISSLPPNIYRPQTQYDIFILPFLCYKIANTESTLSLRLTISCKRRGFFSFIINNTLFNFDIAPPIYYDTSIIKCESIPNYTQPEYLKKCKLDNFFDIPELIKTKILPDLK
jgi:hypothetical protein